MRILLHCTLSLQHCSANHVGKERITILLSTWPKWDRVGEIGSVHTVTKGESGGEPRAQDHTTAYLSRLHESYGERAAITDNKG
jgi:hypothetical protein